MFEIIIGGVIVYFFYNWWVGDEDEEWDEEWDEDDDKPKRKRKPISKSIRNEVWNRDGGKCVECGSKEKIEFDHIIPFSKGGTDTYRNLQILCEKCNRSKSNKIG
jgi:5-methylcytosine-specific restriction endonuclease McrA